MRRSMIIGNWKMHTRAADAHVLATTVRNGVSRFEGVEVVLCPPSIWLSEVSGILGRGKTRLGAQNVFYEPEGAFTGEISPLMAKDLCDYVILGHSERREYFGETDIEINEKVIASLKAGLSPIICVGEKKKSKTYPTGVVKQLVEALAHVPKKDYKNIIVAYEPVWAISTTKGVEDCPPEYASRVISSLREVVLRDSPILYGGSVNSKNAEGFARRPEIDGCLVGGASLRAADFIKVCEIWAKAKSFK